MLSKNKELYHDSVDNMTAEHAFHVSVCRKFLAGIYTVQKRLNLFGVTQGEAEESPETSITGKAFTAVVMTIGMDERFSWETY